MNKSAAITTAVLQARDIMRASLAEKNGIFKDGRLDRINKIRFALMNEGFTHSQVHDMINAFDPAEPNIVEIPAIQAVA